MSLRFLAVPEGNHPFEKGYEMQSSTGYESRLVASFRKQPAGHTVVLEDGSEVVVKAHEDTPKGAALQV